MIAGLQDTVYTLAASGTVLYAGRASGLYRSVDGGTNWENIFVSLNRPNALAVTALATMGGVVFAGVNGAVLRSEDAGDTWQIVALSSPPPQVSALAISPNFANDGVVIAGTSEDGIFVSNDRGVTWTPWNFGLIDPNVFALAISPDFQRDQTIFAGTVSGIFRSQNGGRAWRETSFPMGAAPVLSLVVAPDGLIYAGTEAHGLLVSDDFGAGWRQVSDLPVMGVNALYASETGLWLLIEDHLLSSPDGVRWQQHESVPVGKTGLALLPQPATPGMVMVGCAEGDLLSLR